MTLPLKMEYSVRKSALIIKRINLKTLLEETSPSGEFFCVLWVFL